MEALVAYYRKYEPTVPNFRAVVTLGTRELAREEFRGRSADASTTARADAAGAGGWRRPARRSRSRSRATATGTLFYAARLRYAVDALYQDGLDSGFHIERRYEPYVENGTGRRRRRYAAGDLVRVTLTFRLTKERRFVAVTDPLPAGFEAVESWFATTARDLAAQQDRQTNAGGDAQDWRNWWRYSGFDHVERHDDRIQLFATRLGEGVHEFSYIVARHDRRHVPYRAGPGRRDVRAGSVRPNGDHTYRGEAVRDVASVRARWHADAADDGSRCCVSLLGLWLRCGPLPAGLLDEPSSPSTLVVDRHGVPLHEALSSEQTRAHAADAPTRLPPMLVAATVAAEDRRFWQHVGVDPLRSSARSRRNLAEGASSRAAPRSRSRWPSCC